MSDDYYLELIADLERQLLRLVSSHADRLNGLGVSVDVQAEIRANAFGNVLATLAVASLSNYGAGPAPTAAELTEHLRAAPWARSAELALIIDAKRRKRFPT